MTSEFPELPDDIWARILGIYSHCPRAVYMVSKIARVSKLFFEYAQPVKISKCPELPVHVWVQILRAFVDLNGLYAPKELEKISRVSTAFFYMSRTHPDNIPALSILERAAIAKFKKSQRARSRIEHPRDRDGEHNAIQLILQQMRNQVWWQWPVDPLLEELRESGLSVQLAEEGH